MKTSNELACGLAVLLGALRKRHGLSKAKMADLLYIDPHTWAKYESGESAPTVPEFLSIFNTLGESALRPVLNYLFPDIYANLTPESSVEELRAAAAHFITNVATDHFVREFNYLVLGKSVSNVEANFDRYTMMAHLPMRDNVILDNLIDELYTVCSERDELINTQHVMPDVQKFRDAYHKATAAVIEGKNGYTSATE